MTVETFDPKAGPAGARLEALSDADLNIFLAAGARLQDEQFGLAHHQVVRLARLARTDGADWQASARQLDAARIEQLIRLLVLAETRLPGWESGARSPVVVLAALLKDQGAYPAGLTAWIRSHTDNRFLPYGSLLDRL